MLEIREYLYKEVEKIVDRLFQQLKNNNINVELERKELNEKELILYKEIYNIYEKDLINLKEKAILKYGYIENLDFIFAVIIQEIVNKKEKEII